MNVMWKSHIPTEPKQEYAYKFTHISCTINLNPATEKIAVYKFIISSHKKQQYSKHCILDPNINFDNIHDNEKRL
jgi:BarA-like signal transduction histidine kinase